ncbi:MAG: trimethylamine--corrinoid protein Co-methyltransferase [bacterium]|jgi:trimethylamine--corrinoid protein Co-methyltransferase
MERFKDAFYQPFLSDWQNHENWALSGAEDTTQRATKIWQKALTEYEAPDVDQAIKEELQDYIARCKLNLGHNVPALEPVYF